MGFVASRKQTSDGGVKPEIRNLQPRETFIILTSVGPLTVILTAGKERINRIDKIETPELAGISLLSHQPALGMLR